VALNLDAIGETLTTEGWKTKDGRCIFRTVNQDGRPVLNNGIARVGPG